MIEPSTGQHVEAVESTIQEPVGVAFQGERGAFSDEAVKRYFGSEAEPFPCRSFSEVFPCCRRGRNEARTGTGGKFAGGQH